MNLDTTLQQGSDEFVKWFKRYAIPLWSIAGVDVKTGACVERFLSNGQVDKKANLRVRVVARQIFTFSRAHQLGWIENGEPLVAGLLDFARQYGRHKQRKGYVHLLSPSHQLLDDRLDLYDHAFWLLSCAARYRAFKDIGALAHAYELTEFIDASLGRAGGGWREGDYAADCRRQNPHMHLFEAFMALYEASEDAKWLGRAGEIYCLFESRFFDGKYGVLREFFDDNWNLADTEKGNIIEPGHMMEWVWLLRWYQRLTGVLVDDYANSLFQNGLKIGLAKSGLPMDSVTPQGNILNGSQRCWTVTELIKACVAQAREGYKGAEALAGKSVRLLLEKYLQSRVAGLYVDQRDRDDNVCVDVAPASTLYHLIVAADELQQYLRENGHADDQI